MAPLPTLNDEPSGSVTAAADGTRIQLRESGRTVLVRVVGPLDLEHAELFLSRVERVATSGRRVIVDLLQADYVDSSGVRALLQLQSRVHGVHGDLRLVIRTGSRVERVFTLLRLIDQFSIYRSTSEAWDGRHPVS